MEKLSRFGTAAMAAALFLMSSGYAPAADAGGAPEASGPEEMGAPAPITGTVVETMNSGGYTYVQVEQQGGNTVWVAAPETRGIQKGQVLMFRPGYAMPNFKSSTLKRTFDSIVFSPGLMDLSKVKDSKNQASPGSAGAVPEQAHVKVEKASGANAYTVGEVYEKADKLSGQEVTVRGKVAKVSLGIMGKNWLHIQDGTGVPEKGTHDLVVTTADTAKTGDTVTATGKLTKDRDFGAGYKYDAIIEDAAVTK